LTFKSSNTVTQPHGTWKSIPHSSQSLVNYSNYSLVVSSVCVHTGDLGEPVLLHVWISVPRLHHPHHLLFTNLHRHGLLPALWRGILEFLHRFKYM